MFRATCGLFVLGVLAAQNCFADDAGNAVSESVSNVVTINDVAKVVVGKNDTLDVKSQAAQINAALASNPDQAKGVNKDNFLLSMMQAKVFEYVLAEAAKKINLQNDPATKERIDEMTRQILVRSYVGKVMGDRIKPEDVQKAYEEYKKNFEKPKPGIEIGHILVKDEATAKEVMAALDKGEKFEDVARKYSIAASKDNGGREEVLPVDELPPPMAELKTLEIGQHAKSPFQSQMGFHIVAVLDKKNVEALPFEKIQRQIEAGLFKVELEKLTKTLLKTVSVKGYNAQGKEIDIMPLLMQQISPMGAVEPAPEASSRPVPAIKEQAKTPSTETNEAQKKNELTEEKPAVEQKKTSDVAHPADEVEAEPAEEEVGFFQGIWNWVKSFF